MTGAESSLRLKLPRAGFELNVDLRLPAQGITALFGASGSGKTSLLRCVAGLERARAGLVGIAGEVWQDDAAGVFVPAWQRPVGYVFQEASLFEHLDVRGNLAFGLQRARPRVGMQALDDAIDLLGLRPLLQRRTGELSGGERQRVAIARALVTRPRLMLLDEPLAALDRARRQDILPWLEKLRDELRMPMLYVTHAADEVARLADHVVVLSAGKVSVAGPVAEVLAAVHGPMVMGEDAGALLQATVGARDARWQLMRVDFAGGCLWLRDDGVALGRPVRLRVLARDASLATAEPRHTSIQNHLPGVVESLAAGAHPSQALVRVACGTALLLARVTRRAVFELQLRPGLPVWVQVKSVALVQ